MKKCPGCERELDKYGIAYQYCGKVEEAREKEKKLSGESKLKKHKTRGWKKG